jgi:hypothetical protein
MDNPLADYTTDSDSEEEDDEVAFHCGFAVGLCISVYSSRFDKQPVHTSMLSGQQWCYVLYWTYGYCLLRTYVSPLSFISG